MPEKCQRLGLHDALESFARARSTQNQRHIVPLHWCIACRLCLEGGFHPDEITPRPPFVVELVSTGSAQRRVIRHEPQAGDYGERTVLGGRKTKDVDVAATKPEIGPAIAVSMKGALGAFRNLTNRLEEACGDCTNLHMTYPLLVYGYWAVLRADRASTPPLARGTWRAVRSGGPSHRV